MSNASTTRPLRLVPQAAQTVDFACPLCGSEHAAYIFGTSRFRIHRCAGCALTFSTEPARARELANSDSTSFVARTDRGERHHAMLWAALESAVIGGEVLVVAEPGDAIIPLLEGRGIKVGRVAGHDDFGPGDWGGPYKGAIVSDALMRVDDPRAALTKIHNHLADGAPLIVSVPLLDGRQARWMGRNWHEWQPWNRWYFTRETLNLLLLSAGFEQVWFRPERRKYSLDNLLERVHRSEDSEGWQRLLHALRRMSPASLRNREFPLPSGTAVVSAVAVPKRSENVVSIVVPVFNERSTFQMMMDALLAKQLPGLRKEIIIVESNSTDGSRDLVQTYADHPDVRVVLQPGPRGKGHAVREGLMLATGDFIVIQDADLEYDLDDYDGLLEPLSAWQSMFILGSRHQGGWKMRKFTDSPFAALFLNLGHVFFRTLVNVALGTKIADPFTMYKVFRRDALFGLEFTCNRFDFDIELLMKLVRKGYVPIELPVNYVSRSFAEGKKVSVVRDGMTWVGTILKARFTPIGPGPA